MPKTSEKDRVKRWFERIQAANKVYDRWAERFMCDRLVQYYCGDQWPEFQPPERSPRYRPYTINLVFPTIETQQPSLLFYRPTVKIEPKPPYGDDPQTTIALRAKLCEDTVQTFINKPEIHFKLQTLLALRDANFRFGVVEVGYTADWIDNPHAGKPMLKHDTGDEPMLDKAGQQIVQPGKLPRSEQLFLKRIDPCAFRVSISSKNVLNENDGCGYYEWHYVEDVKRNPKYHNTRELKPSGEAKDYPSVTDDQEREKHRGMVKLWKWWDFRSKTRCVLADGHDKYLLEGEAWTYLPLAVLKFFEIPGEFYPLPPVSNWIGPQDEINETRESRRGHRRRFHRRYTYYSGGIDDGELEKLETGGDGVYAKRNTPDDPIMPVQDAPLGADFDKSLAESRDDFLNISGVGAEARGVAESDTATQANIVDVRMRIRETAGRSVVADWLGEVCRIMLLTIREKMQLPFWIRENADALAADPNEILRIVATWKEITAADLGNGALDVTVDVTSLSPVSEEQRAQQWTQLWAVITGNPQFALILSLSEPILRRTLKYYGITNEGDIREIQMVLKNMVMMQVAAQTAQAGGAGVPGSEPGQPAGLPAQGPALQ